MSSKREDKDPRWDVVLPAGERMVRLPVGHPWAPRGGWLMCLPRFDDDEAEGEPRPEAKDD